MTQAYGRNYKNILPIFRRESFELDEAIENLEGRGYELIDRGVEKAITSKRFWARMKKLEETV